MTARWIADPPDHRIAMPLDELTAIFHRPSGATHLLAIPAPELLDALSDGAADAAGLIARLSARYDLGDADVEAIAARLAELEDAGLVRRG